MRPVLVCFIMMHEQIGRLGRTVGLRVIYQLDLRANRVPAKPANIFLAAAVSTTHD